jgi:hypothetical protein
MWECLMAETPTTEMIRARYNSEGILSGSEFDRWLAKHDSEVLRSAAREIPSVLTFYNKRIAPCDWLMVRAQECESAGPDA